jgi:nitrogen fixation NifU-like protein
MYSDIVKDHFKNPRNVGELEQPDGVGEVGNPVCGDMMKIQIKVKDERIDDIKFLTFGCGAAIAVSSMLTEMVKGKTLDEARKVSNKDVAEALAGLPKNKLHCSNLGADALHMAIKDYEDRLLSKTRPEAASRGGGTGHKHEQGDKCYCPYCDAELPEKGTGPVCTNCGQPIELEHEVHE